MLRIGLLRIASLFRLLRVGLLLWIPLLLGRVGLGLGVWVGLPLRGVGSLLWRWLLRRVALLWRIGSRIGGGMWGWRVGWLGVSLWRVSSGRIWVVSCI